MNVTKVTKKIHRYNEDGIFIKKNLYVVMDGASSLYEVNTNISDAAKFISFIKGSLKNYQSGDIIDFLTTISQDYYEKYYYHQSLEPAQMPSCGMVICQIIADEVVIYNIGDVEACIVTILDKYLIKQEELEKLDNSVLKVMQEMALTKGISILDARKEVNDLLIDNRNLMNQKNGYFVFNPSLDGKFNFTKHVFKRNDIQGIFLATDGYASAYKQFKLYDNYCELYQLDRNIKEVCQQLITKSEEDSLCNKYPRFKKRDDISIVKIDFRK